MKKTLLIFVLTCLGIWSCENSSNIAISNSGYFLTLLGNDTLAIEQFEKSENGISAKVLLRSPRTVYFEYELTQNSEGGMTAMTRYSQDPQMAFTPNGKKVSQELRVIGDSLVAETTTNNGLRRMATLNKEGTLPFIDMVHWPYELAFNQAAKNELDSIHQMLFTGRNISDFIIHKAKADSMTLRHPSRGVMGVDVDENGNLLKLDAALTTRKLIVKRIGTMDFEGLVKDFAQRDKNGSPFSGDLSGAVEEQFSFGGTDFKVTYGSPKKRGRAIFGGIVSYGKRWRTGANRATHFSTSSNLTIGDFTVPAGEYTLFSIPENGGGILIINKQTGQNGQSYDESRDLLRIPLTISNQDKVTENFTIKVVENSKGGSINLIWDRTILSVDFEIK